MNAFIIIGFVLAGGIIAFNHLVYALPQWLAIMLYSISVILFIIGIIINKKSKVRKAPACNRQMLSQNFLI